MAIIGIDVSSVQKKIDWKAVEKTGINFAIAKCGNGNNGIDPFFVYNMVAIKATSIALGIYNVGFPLLDDPAHPGRNPVDQAKMHFNASNSIGMHPGDLPVTLDLEWPVPGP